MHTICHCGCGKTFDLAQNSDQYITYVSAYKLCERIKIDRKDNEDDILKKLENFNQTLGSIIKDELCSSIMFPDLDHAKK